MGQPRSIQRISVRRSSSVRGFTLPAFTASGGGITLPLKSPAARSCFLRQLLRPLAVVLQSRKRPGLVDAVDTLVGHERSRPLFVVLGIVLDEAHGAGLHHRLAA